MAVIDRRRPVIRVFIAATLTLGACGIELRTVIVESSDAGDVVTTRDVAEASVDVPMQVDGDALDVTVTVDGTDGAPDVDAPIVPDTVAPPDVAPADPVRAGALCTMPTAAGGVDPACGSALRCLPTSTTPWCSAHCTNNLMQTAEQAMCGGAGTTCLTSGDPPMGDSFCARACVPAATRGTPGSCRAGYVCTGWWFTYSDGTPDAPGCAPFCERDSDCSAGQLCNSRIGLCGARGVDMTRLPDGSPCDPTVTEMVPGEMRPRNTRCRGACFDVSSHDPTQGLCGSYIDFQASGLCPDNPTAEPDRIPGADNLALCVVRDCATNADCRAPLICRHYETPTGMIESDSPTECMYPTMSQPTGIR